MLRPLIKYVGGKQLVIPQIEPFFPDYTKYLEPFVGSAAVLLHLQPKSAIINDLNEEIPNLYRVVRDNPDELIAALTEHAKKANPNEEYFYQTRALDREQAYQSMPPVAKAARLIYLQKNCFNGLPRYNSRGQYNTSFGKYVTPNVCDPELIFAVSKYLKENDIEITSGDFADTLGKATKGDFCYLDPPYATKDNSSIGYNRERFSLEEQIRLRNTVDELTKKGCYVMLSNSSQEVIWEMYSNYKIIKIYVPERVNSDGEGRGDREEVVILNY